MAKVKPTNTVRFAWWGAEESGLLGSEHYVDQLTERRGRRHRALPELRHGRLAQLHVRRLRRRQLRRHRGPGLHPARARPRSRTSSSSSTPSRGEPFQDSEFSGRSDYGPFIAVGIPAGGLFTGAEVPKTAAEAALYGGVAGAAYDPCYHQFCDNLTGAGQNAALYDAAARRTTTLVGNINVHALDVNSDAIATAVLTFAYDTSTVNGVPGHPGRGQVKSDGSERTLATIRDQRTRYDDDGQ